MKLLLQMIHEDGTLCVFPAGGPIEIDLVESVVSEIMKRGLVMKMSNHIEKDIREGLKQALFNFKLNSLVLIVEKK